MCKQARFYVLGSNTDTLFTRGVGTLSSIPPAFVLRNWKYVTHICFGPTTINRRCLSLRWQQDVYTLSLLQSASRALSPRAPHGYGSTLRRPPKHYILSCCATASARQVLCNTPVIEREYRKNRAASTCPGQVWYADADYHPSLQGGKAEKLAFSLFVAASRTNFESIHGQRTPGEPLAGSPPLPIGAGEGQSDCVLPGGGLPNMRIPVLFASAPPPSRAISCAVEIYVWV